MLPHCGPGAQLAGVNRVGRENQHAGIIRDQILRNGNRDAWRGRCADRIVERPVVRTRPQEQEIAPIPLAEIATQLPAEAMQLRDDTRRSLMPLCHHPSPRQRAPYGAPHFVLHHVIGLLHRAAERILRLLGNIAGDDEKSANRRAPKTGAAARLPAMAAPRCRPPPPATAGGESDPLPA